LSFPEQIEIVRANAEKSQILKATLAPLRAEWKVGVGTVEIVNAWARSGGMLRERKVMQPYCVAGIGNGKFSVA